MYIYIYIYIYMNLISLKFYCSILARSTSIELEAFFSCYFYKSFFWSRREGNCSSCYWTEFENCLF